MLSAPSLSLFFYRRVIPLCPELRSRAHCDRCKAFRPACHHTVLCREQPEGFRQDSVSSERPADAPENFGVVRHSTEPTTIRSLSQLRRRSAGILYPPRRPDEGRVSQPKEPREVPIFLFGVW